MLRSTRIVFGLFLLTCGCNRSAAPPPPPPQSVPKPLAAPVREVSVAAPVEEPAIEKPSHQAAAIAAAKVDSKEELNSSDGAPDDKPTQHASPERIALLTPGGPLILDVWVTVDGRPYREIFAALVKVVLDAADVDKDGRATWKELADNTEYLKSIQPPNAPSMGTRQMKMYIERFDENRDGQIQFAEAASWLGRDAGVIARAFTLRSNRSYSANPRASSRVWQLLDTNRDGELSTDETDRAPEKLMALDSDDDRVIAPAELASLPEQLEAERNRVMEQYREANRYAALHLDPQYNMDRLEYLLSDMYSPRQMLGPASFPELAGLYEKMDANSDGWLEQLELADFLTIDPQLEIAVAFNEPTPPQDSAATLEIRHQAPEIATVAQPSPDRVILRLGSTLLILSAHDLAPMQADYPAQAADQSLNRSQIQLMVHDQYDAMFEELDMNADGRLGEREIFNCAERLRNRDADGDGRLANTELPYSMIVAFLRGERANEQYFYVPASAAKRSAAAQAPEWFQHADFNGDGDVSRREFLGSLEKFSQLDANQDGYIDAAEATAFKTE